MSRSPTIAFAALADPTRLGIVDLLARRGELPAGDISTAFTSSASAISQHLKVLREAGLVSVTRRAQQRIYRLDTVAMAEVEGWLSDRARQWNGRLDAMAAYIEKTRQETHDGE
ncbi:metalloregulator ArsR/SmtB family transcription factor [Sinomonas albida]|uniref:ArsR/SmtB family transcription factor n=1 Tax=Sinomonas albida TaxID=369942 RepID=UPI00301AC9FB